MNDFDANSNLKDSNRGHIIKTFTWRIVGTFDTIIISWLISGNVIGFKNWNSRSYYQNDSLFYMKNFGIRLIMALNLEFHQLKKN